MRKGLSLSIILCCLFTSTGSGQNGTDAANSRISRETWNKTRQGAVIGKKPRENDFSELLSRLNIVERGEELDPVALERTVARANNLFGGYGWTDRDGYKRLFSVYILAVRERNMRISQLEVSIKAQQEAITSLQSQIEELKHRLDKASGSK